MGNARTLVTFRDVAPGGLITSLESAAPNIAVAIGDANLCNFLIQIDSDY